jgi:hypothetical protein
MEIALSETTVSDPALAGTSNATAMSAAVAWPRRPGGVDRSVTEILRRVQEGKSDELPSEL